MTEADDNLTEESSGLLSRWSRNKSRNRSGVESANAEKTDLEIDSPATSTAVSSQQAPAQATFEGSPGETSGNPLSDAGRADAEQIDQSVEETDDELTLTDDDMPSIETLNADSDYSGFLNKGVSPELRRKALQHLFRMPKFNIRDGLNDYDEDYTYFEPLGDTVTSDMRWHAARKEREEREAEEARLAAEQEEQLLEADDAESEDAALADDKPKQTDDEAVPIQVADSGPESDPESDLELTALEATTAQSSSNLNTDLPHPQDVDDAGQEITNRQLAIEGTETDDGSVV